MFDVTITPEAIDTIVEMRERVHAMHMEAIAANMANMDATDADVERADRDHHARMAALLDSLIDALRLARGVDGGRIWQDLDGLMVRGTLTAGVVFHRDGKVQVHT